MSVYNYQARTKQGAIEEGEIEAISEEAAFATLDKKDLILTKLTVKKKSFDVNDLFKGSKKVNHQSLMVFTKQLSTMVNAGLSIVESLKTLADEETNKYFSSAILSIAEEVEDGSTLSKALEKYPKVFSPIYINLIKVGESSGKLDEVTIRLADQLDKDYQTRSQVRGAMIYPLFILVTLVGVALLMVTFVMPKLKPILETTGVKLPFSTKVLILLSDSIIQYWWLIIPIIAGIIFAFLTYIKTDGGSKVWGAFKIRIPIIGKVIRNIYMARFSRTFTTMISGGVNIIDALEITAKSIGNVNYANDVLAIAQEVKNGTSLAIAFKRSDIASQIVKKMIHVGESTGTLDTTMEKVAIFYEEEVVNAVSNLSKTLEPVLIVLMGVAVAVVASSVIMPLYDATRNVGSV